MGTGYSNDKSVPTDPPKGLSRDPSLPDPTAADKPADVKADDTGKGSKAKSEK